MVYIKNSFLIQKEVDRIIEAVRKDYEQNKSIIRHLDYNSVVKELAMKTGATTAQVKKFLDNYIYFGKLIEEHYLILPEFSGERLILEQENYELKEKLKGEQKV